MAKGPNAQLFQHRAGFRIAGFQKWRATVKDDAGTGLQQDWQSMIIGNITAPFGGELASV
jgi:hypothetical protein